MKNPVSAAFALAAVFTATVFTAIGASAQGGAADVAYCKALADKYVDYVGHDLGASPKNQTSGTTAGQVAVAQCREGKAASAIPVLEQELTRARITLPARG